MHLLAKFGDHSSNIEMEISILTSNLNTRNTDFQFQTPRYGRQKNKKENTGNCKAFWVTRKRNNSYQTEIKLLNYFVYLLRLKSFTGIFHDFLATGKNSKTFISSFSLMLRATVESIPFHYQQLAIAKVESSSYIH